MTAQMQQLLLSVRAGDQGAFTQLYEQYLPLIESMTAQFADGLSPTDAEDFHQEAALALYQAALAYRLEQTEVQFGLFAKVCMRNRMIDHLRALKRHMSTETLATDDQAGEAVCTDATRSDPADQLIDAEAIEALNQKFGQTLSVFEQRVLRLYLSGHSAREIAMAVGRDERSVENAIYRIRRKLRALLHMPG